MYIHLTLLALLACAAAQCNTAFLAPCGLQCSAPTSTQLVIPANTQRSIDTPPTNRNAILTLETRGISGKATGGVTSSRLILDGGAVGMGFQIRVSYDYTGDGNWDLHATSPIITTDGSIGQYQTFSYSFGNAPRDLSNGAVRVEVWSTYPMEATGKLRAGSSSSTITIPYGSVSGLTCKTIATSSTTRASTVPSTVATSSTFRATTSSTVASTVRATTSSTVANPTTRASTSSTTPPPSTTASPVNVNPVPAPVRSGPSVNAKWSSLYNSVVGDVVITSGQRILLDVASLRAGVITIQQNAALVFDSAQNSIDVTAAAIVVQGEFWIGTESDPFTSPVNIVLSGSTDITIDGLSVGTKVVVVGNGGVLEWHGVKGLTQSWTTLGATAPRGSSRLVLSEPFADSSAKAGWRVGDDIIVAGTDYSPDMTERVSITRIVSSTEVEISPSLSYYHHGTITMGMDERAEVGLLTRTIAVRSGSEGRLGAHVIFMSGSQARVEGVLGAGLGQDQIGRYPFHWHMAGDQSNSYIRDSSVQDSIFRCVTIHGTHNVRVENMVTFGSQGHCMYMEDGVERGNVFRNNLVTNVKEKTSGERIGSDLGTAVSGFWITSPDNIFENNVVVGSPGAGYWVHCRMGPRGLSMQTGLYNNYRPAQTNLRAFTDNKAVGCDHGFQIEATMFDHMSLPYNPAQESPMTAYAPQRDGKDDPVYLDGFIAHHNRFRGLWARAPIVYVRDGKFSNNMEGIQIATSGDHPAPGSIGFIEDSLVLGWTDNIGNNLFNNWQMWNNDRQRSWPRNGIPMVGVAYYDGPQVLRRITFAGWKVEPNETPHSAVGTRFHGEFQVASTNQLADCTFNDVTYRSYVSDRNGDGGRAFNFRVPSNSMGTPKGTVLTKWPFYETPNCQKDATYGLLCPQRYGQMWVIDFENRGNNPLVINRNEHVGTSHKDFELLYRGFHSAGIWRYQPLVSFGASYLVRFNSLVSGSLAFQLNNGEKGDAVGLSVCYPAGTAIKKVSLGYSNKLGGGLLPPIMDASNQQLSAVSSRAELTTKEGYHWDANRRILSVNLKQRLDRTNYANFCPDGGCDFIHVDASVPAGAAPGDCTADAYSGDSLQITTGAWLNTQF